LARCRTLHAATLSSIIGWLYRKEAQPALFEDVASAIEVAYALDRAGTPAIAGRYVSELHNVRKCITRMGVISRTGALASGFAFLQFLTTTIIILLLLSKFRHPVSEAILVSFVSLIYIYMMRLIKDIDDPFEYHPDGKPRSCAEVELFPILEYQQRLHARIAVVVPNPKAPPSSGESPTGAHTSSKDLSNDPHGDHATLASTANQANTTAAASSGATNNTHENPPAAAHASSSSDGASHHRSPENGHSSQA
jgi:hypothetical protein